MLINKYMMKLLFLVFALLGLYGCLGGEVNVQVKPVDYKVASKQDKKIVLLLTEEFRNAKWESEPVGFEANIVHLGGNFATNSKNLASAVFSNVVVVNSENEITNDMGDLVLKPKMISVTKNRPLWAWNDSTMTVVLEWSLSDMDKNKIWVASIKGEGAASITDDEKRLKLLMDDLFNKSYTEISSSPEIKNHK